MRPPLPIDHIPSELIRLIVKKLEPVVYGRLFRSCHWMRDLCDDCKDIYVTAKNASVHALPDKMIVSISPYILECDPEQTDFHPFRFIVGELEIGIYIVPIPVKKLTELVRKTKTTCSSLIICGTVVYNTEEIKEFLELVQPTALSLLGYPVTKQFSPWGLLAKMAAIRLQNSDYGDEEVLALKAKNIEINCCGLTSRGVNQLLKQWLLGERKIDSVVLYGEVAFSVEEIVEDLPTSLLYNADYHQFSIFKDLKQPPGKIKDTSLYILMKSDDLSQKLMLIVKKDEIQCFKCLDPVETFLNYLTRFDSGLLSITY